MGPGTTNLRCGGMFRKIDLAARCAHFYTANRDKLRACYADGEAARDADDWLVDGKSPKSKHEAKLLAKRKISQLQTANNTTQVMLDMEVESHKRTKNALGHAKSRAKIHRDNLRKNMERARTKMVSRLEGHNFEERNAAQKLIKLQLAELVKLRLFAKSREGQSNPAELRRKNKALADERHENFKLRLENDRLAREKIQNDEEYAKLKAFAAEKWLPTRQTGPGTGRGTRHDPRIRILYYKLLTLRVAPEVVNNVRARRATHATS